jgi:hypothetical protein
MSELSDWYGYEDEAISKEQEDEDWVRFKSLDLIAEYYERKGKDRYVPTNGIKTQRITK